MTPFEGAPRPDIADRPIEFEFMSAGEWLDFNCELYDVVAELGLDVDAIDAGMIRLGCGRTMRLLQLAQHCHLRPRDDWHELIGSHLQTMVTQLAAISRAAVADLSVFDLRVRLVPDDPADREVFRELCVRPFADGVVEVLSVDVPDAVRIVSRRELGENGIDVEEAWASAWLQTESLEQPDEVNVIDVGGSSVVHVFGERVFTASLVGRIEDFVGPIGPNGALVSIPHSHSILVHVIDDITVTIAVSAMIPITRQVHRQGPGSVSPHLYWWRNGELACIPTYFAADGVEAYPSPELVAVLRTLR
jgi:hypothetical protein